MMQDRIQRVYICNHEEMRQELGIDKIVHMFPGPKHDECTIITEVNP